MKCNKCGSLLPQDSDFCQYCGNRLPSAMPESRPKAGRGTILLRVAAGLAVVLLCLSLYQSWSLKNQNNRLQSRLLAVEAENDELKQEVYDEKVTAAGLKIDADCYNHIIESLQNCDIGYASYHFRAYESVIVLRKNDRDRKFTLVANWEEGGNVSVSYSSPAATVSFDEGQWDESTTMTVHPKSVGATVVTFTNNVDSGRFKILILVTE